MRAWLSEPAVQWLVILAVGFLAMLALSGTSAAGSLLIAAGVATGSVFGNALRRARS